ncbi:hypothetical protein T492DRAFT_890832 [Pavlovales sp. CCMP2436]|nr:hypothetical protein T492DRAFT_890832 [Pavlovales sp. CCMP2436]
MGFGLAGPLLSSTLLGSPQLGAPLGLGLSLGMSVGMSDQLHPAHRLLGSSVGMSATQQDLATAALAMLLVVCGYQRRLELALCALVVLFACLGLLNSPPAQESALQALSAIVGASAVFSPITATLLTGGNALRAWTTTQLADGDGVLLLGCALGFTVNGALLAQILYYGLDSIDAGSTSSTKTSDFN